MGLMREFVEQMNQDAGGVAVWSFRLHQTLRAFRETMLWVEAYSTSKDEDEKDFAEVMLMYTCNHEDFLDMFPRAIKGFDRGKHTREYLVVLVTTSHLLLRLIQA